jgi:hypothetical protein
MTQAEFQKQTDAMIENQYRTLGIDPDDPRGMVTTPEQDKLALERYIAELKAREKSDPEFRDAYINHLVSQTVDRYDIEHRPKGEYREDGTIPLSDTRRVQMPRATREHLLSWALLESDERNLAFIKNRLDLWERHPVCKNLAELEAAICS